jgi:hypothetical protein
MWFVVADGDQEALSGAYLDSLTELEFALNGLQAELAEGVATITVIRAFVDRGGKVSELLETGQLQSVRREIGAALKGVERARHVRDQLLFRCLRAEGLSAAEIGRHFGISRGLVSRLLNEPN